MSSNHASLGPLEGITEDGGAAGPEMCFGYLKKEISRGNWMKLFFLLNDGVLSAFKSETSPGSRKGDKFLDNMDLDGWALALPTPTTILLSPPNDDNEQVILYESNGREYSKWATAFNEHISYMDYVTGRIAEVTQAVVADIPSSPPPSQPNSPRDNTQTSTSVQAVAITAAPVAAAVAPPAVVIKEEKKEAEYMDKRGILMQEGESNNKNRYAEQTLQILREQLIKEGKMPLEFIPLEDLKKEMSSIFAKANAGEEYDESRLDYLLKCMDLNPDYKAEKEKETAAWRATIDTYTKECLRIMRGFVPPHIFHSTMTTLTQNDKLPADLAKRLLAKKCLWLVRISTADIAKMHIAELQGRFNPEAQGLDIIELAAIFANIPEKFLNDDSKGSKEKWRLSIEECLKQYYTQNKDGKLAKLKVRNPAYKNLEPFFTQEEVLHKLHVTSSTEAFNRRASFRQIRTKQSLNQEVLDVTNNGHSPLSPSHIQTHHAFSPSKQGNTGTLPTIIEPEDSPRPTMLPPRPNLFAVNQADNPFNQMRNKLKKTNSEQGASGGGSGSEKATPPLPPPPRPTGPSFLNQLQKPRKNSMAGAAPDF